MSVRTASRLIAAGLVAAALFLPSRLIAQGTDLASASQAAPVVEPAAAVVTSAAVLAGPRIESAGIRRTTIAAEHVPPMRYHGESRDVAWMVIGGATLVVGSLIGGDGGTIMMITGGVVGLMGLWRYMQ